jgi:hypothetical protein
VRSGLSSLFAALPNTDVGVVRGLVDVLERGSDSGGPLQVQAPLVP